MSVNKKSTSCSSERTVAFLDILAFKEIRKKYSSLIIGQTYERATESAVIYCKKWSKKFGYMYSQCDVHIFSDSIAIFSPDDSLNSFLSVSLHVKHLMQSLIVHQFPIRGAIAFGDVFIGKNSNIFVGDGYERAVALEKKQNWIGVSIDESVQNKFSKYFNEGLISNLNIGNNSTVNIFSEPSIIRYRVSMKNGDTELRYTINWLDGFSFLDNNQMKRPHKDLLEIIIKNIPPDSENIEKYHTTAKYIEYINSIISVENDGTQRHMIYNIVY